MEAHQGWLREKLEAQVEKSLSGILHQYLDPASGKFATKADMLAKLQADLPKQLQDQISAALGPLLSGDTSEVARTIAAQIGASSEFVRRFDPQNKGSVVATITEQVKLVLDQQNREFQDQFSFDKEGSALKRLVSSVEAVAAGLKQDFDLNNEGSALKRLSEGLSEALKQTQERINSHLSLDTDGSALRRVHDTLQKQLADLSKAQTESATQVAKQQAEFFAKVEGMVADLKARKEERAKGTGQGLDFEAALYARVQQLSGPGETVEQVGHEVGVVPRSKVGDVLLTLDAAHPWVGDRLPRIVFEAKSEGGWTPRKAWQEIQAAVENRQADAGVFVLATDKARPEDWPQRLVRLDRDLLVLWDPEDPAADAFLQAAVHVARFIAGMAGAGEANPVELDWDVVNKALANLNKQAERFDSIQTKANTIKSSADAIFEEARIMRDHIKRDAGRLAEQLESLQAGDSGV